MFVYLVFFFLGGKMLFLIFLNYKIFWFWYFEKKIRKGKISKKRIRSVEVVMLFWIWSGLILEFF